jgi:probable phosphoglycerate mutase
MPRSAAAPRPTLVVFVRHGETPTTGKALPGRAPGLHLSDHGQAQAKEVAARLAVLGKVDAIYTSPLERTRETARPTAEVFGLKPRVERGFVEADVGDWTGRDLGAVRKEPAWKTVHQWPSGFRFPGGESFPELQARAVGAVERLRSAHPGQTVVVFSHADTIKVVAASALGIHLDLFQRIVISPCSVTAIAYGPGGPLVLCVNSVGDLQALKPS